MVHVGARRLHDVSELLNGLGTRDPSMPPQPGLDDKVHQSGRPEAHDGQAAVPSATRVRDIYIPDLSPAAISAKPRDFR